jgi:hypothetical protein
VRSSGDSFRQSAHFCLAFLTSASTSSKLPNLAPWPNALLINFSHSAENIAVPPARTNVTGV